VWWMGLKEAGPSGEGHERWEDKMRELATCGIGGATKSDVGCVGEWM